jgi:hypothetical protein
MGLHLWMDGSNNSLPEHFKQMPSTLKWSDGQRHFLSELDQIDPLVHTEAQTLATSW